MRRVLITGSSGLIGSEGVAFFEASGWEVHGIDNNSRRAFFGPDGDTRLNLARLLATTRHFTHHDFDIRDRRAVFDLMREQRPALIIHCAAQPSHELAGQQPLADFEVNATGTLNVLEAVRQYCAESPFIFMSTNKVYGDRPNQLSLVELETRYDYADPKDQQGIDETLGVDASRHSLFGASKLAADILAQEYGHYFGMPTVCFRAGCVTGAKQAGAEQHGFLAYLARAVSEGRVYRIFGYKGKQVRDNIHAFDVCTAFLAFFENPRSAAVYNLGGGRENSVSVIEAIRRFEDLMGKKLACEYVEPARYGDHICYISDTRRFKSDFPNWRITRSLDDIMIELAFDGRKG